MTKRKKQKKLRKRTKSKRKSPLDFLYNSKKRRELTKRDYYGYIVNILRDYDGDVLDELLEKAIYAPVAKKFVNFEGFTCEAIGQSSRLPTMANDSKEIIYLSKLFLLYEDSLKQFVDAKKEFEKYYFIGDIKKSIEILDEFESNYGLTIWGIENRIYCEFEKKGVEGAKLTCLRYKKEIKNTFIHYLVDQYLSKIEGETPDLHVKTINSVINEFRQGGELDSGDVISSLILPFEYDPERRIYNYLLYLTHMPIFDQYLYFKQSIEEKLIAGEEDSLNIGLINKFYSRFHCDDSPVEKVKTKPEIDVNIRYAIRDYTLGDYESSSVKCKILLEKDTKYISLIGVYCKSLILEGTGRIEFKENSPLFKVCSYLKSIYVLSKESTLVFKKLEMFIIKYSSQSWTWMLYSQLFEMYPDIFLKYRRFNVKRAVLSGAYLTPKTWFNIYEENESDFFKYISHVLEINNRNDIPESRCIKHDIYRNLSSVYSIEDIPPDDKHLMPFELKKIKAKYYLNSGKIREVSEYIVKECIRNPYLFRIMPIKAVLNNIEKSQNKDEINTINVPILYFIYSKQISDEKDSLLNEAYEDFIDSLEVDKPSEYYSNVDDIDEIEEYFLRYVCITPIMDISPNFQSADELSSERLRILDLLLQRKDIGDKNLLEDEVDSILTATIIDKSTTGIEKSKIDVDVEKLKQEKYYYYSEIFNVYKNTQSGKEIDGDGLFEYKMGESDAVFITDKKDSVLMKLVAEFMFDFASDPDYGLNKYLSADIRHGFFVNQLRARIESLNLITEKSGDVYVDNSHWSSKYSFINVRILRKVNFCLKGFSEKYDDILLNGKSRIDVSFLSSEDEKLFFYSIEFDEFSKIKENAESATDFSDFFEFLEELMWAKTEICLKSVRMWLYDEFLPSLEDCFEDLLLCLKSAKSGVPMNELDESIGLAKNGIKDDVAVVIEWFTRTNEIQLDQLNMHHAIETSINSFVALHSPKAIEIAFIKSEENSDVVLNKNEYKHLILSLITAYNNALQHGLNMIDKPIKVSYLSNPDGSWEIDVANECLCSTQNSSLDKIKRALSLSKNKKLATQEGGTGLYKIKTLITQNFENTEIQFDKNDDNTFILSIRKRS